MYALKPLKDKRLLALWCEIALDTASSKDRPSKEKIIKKVYVLPILCIEKCRGLKKNELWGYDLENLKMYLTDNSGV